jgi:hypothetical protein
MWSPATRADPGLQNPQNKTTCGSIFRPKTIAKSHAIIYIRTKMAGHKWDRRQAPPTLVAPSSSRHSPQCPMKHGEASSPQQRLAGRTANASLPGSGGLPFTLSFRREAGRFSARFMEQQAMQGHGLRLQGVELDQCECAFGDFAPAIDAVLSLLNLVAV